MFVDHRNVCWVLIFIILKCIKNITPKHAVVNYANYTNQVSNHDNFLAFFLDKPYLSPNKPKKTITNEKEKNRLET